MWKADIKVAFQCAIPVMLGYISIGLPCGILADSIGMNPLQMLIMSLVFYSGAGQFMLSNMWLAGADIISIILSICFVNTRQLLYSAAYSPYCSKMSKLGLVLFNANTTDETFGISIEMFKDGTWSARRAYLVNAFSHFSWTASCVVGCAIGPVLNIPVNIASFAMTSIFICLLACQEASKPNVIASVCAFIGVCVAKTLGLAGFSIVVGAVFGVIVALLYCSKFEKLDGPTDGKKSSIQAGGSSD